MEKLVIINTLSPGDYVVLSAAVRDIHVCYPDKYQLMIATPLNCIFDNNPNLNKFEIDKKTRIVEAKYNEGPYCVNESNKQQAHFLWGFLGFLNETLGIKAHLTEFKPDLHLSSVETDKPLIDPPYWLFSSGGKTDFTTKWWDPQCYQEVINEMSKWVKMVQVGHKSHVHPNINNAQNLVGKTSLRDLMRLIYHAEGVICPITCIMHMAAAFNKPCVVVAGGREHWWWEAYNRENRLANMRVGLPGWTPPVIDNFVPHQYLHTIGQLECCDTKGCWKSGIEARPSTPWDVCTKPVSQNRVTIPKCMSMITPTTVIEAVEWYYKNGILSKKGKL